MKDFETVKKELSERTKNTRGFNKAFYKQYIHDLEVGQKALEEAEKLNKRFSVTEYWKTTETHNTWFYKHNGPAYCHFLEIVY